MRQLPLVSLSLRLDILLLCNEIDRKIETNNDFNVNRNFAVCITTTYLVGSITEVKDGFSYFNRHLVRELPLSLELSASLKRFVF